VRIRAKTFRTFFCKCFSIKDVANVLNVVICFKKREKGTIPLQRLRLTKRYHKSVARQNRRPLCSSNYFKTILTACGTERLCGCLSSLSWMEKTRYEIDGALTRRGIKQ